MAKDAPARPDVEKAWRELEAAVFGAIPALDEQVLYEGDPVRFAIAKEFLEMMLDACGDSHVEVWLTKIAIEKGRSVNSLMLTFLSAPEGVPST